MPGFGNPDAATLLQDLMSLTHPTPLATNLWQHSGRPRSDAGQEAAGPAALDREAILRRFVAERGGGGRQKHPKKEKKGKG